ncbi:MAG: DUF4102 domain-containing protein [Acidobacteria bacterium]|nr:DUF4102 domain-containing protein [Acidobacteriota bacterium]
MGSGDRRGPLGDQPRLGGDELPDQLRGGRQAVHRGRYRDRQHRFSVRPADAGDPAQRRQQPVRLRAPLTRRGRHPNKALSAAFVRSAPPGRHADGNGLYLFVQPTGTRSWIQRFVVRGRRRELRLGAAALVPLAKAREQALAKRMLARSGGEPLSEKRRVQGVPTFAEAARRVLEQKRDGWRGRWHVHNWRRSMERYVFPPRRRPARLRSQHDRRAGDPHADLARQGVHGDSAQVGRRASASHIG